LIDGLEYDPSKGSFNLSVLEKTSVLLLNMKINLLISKYLHIFVSSGGSVNNFDFLFLIRNPPVDVNFDNANLLDEGTLNPKS